MLPDQTDFAFFAVYWGKLDFLEERMTRHLRCGEHGGSKGCVKLQPVELVGKDFNMGGIQMKADQTLVHIRKAAKQLLWYSSHTAWETEIAGTTMAKQIHWRSLWNE